MSETRRIKIKGDAETIAQMAKRKGFHVERNIDVIGWGGRVMMKNAPVSIKTRSNDGRAFGLKTDESGELEMVFDDMDKGLVIKIIPEYVK